MAGVAGLTVGAGCVDFFAVTPSKIPLVACLVLLVQAFVDEKKTPAEVKAAVPALAAQLRTIVHIARYVPSDFWFTDQVNKVHTELGGQELPK